MLGTMIPQVKWAHENGFSCIIMNPNYHTKHDVPPEIDSMPQHCMFVWRKYIPVSPAKDIFLVVHSAGGACLDDIILHEDYSD